MRSEPETPGLPASGPGRSDDAGSGGRDLSRLLRPRSVAVIGGGAWCRNVVQQLRLSGYGGAILRVHPNPDPVYGIPALSRIEDLPQVPDAVFIGVNRHQTIDAVRRLSAMGAGGAVCFASGFSEAQAEDAGAGDLQGALVEAAGDMPVLGPNCYGFINALDGALLWPDQHGCTPVDSGVAILTQSSNIAINLTMQQRALPVAFVVTCGNMAQTSQAALARALLDDPRITAIGVHVEGFSDTAEWYELAVEARARNIPIVALKAGVSEQAQAATISHTASLAGSDAGAAALLAHLGIPRVPDLPSFLETLKLLHMAGPLRSGALSSISCSGGEASLMADAVVGRAVHFPPLTTQQRSGLSAALGPMVALSNPLDYHTYIWGDADKMTAAWLPMATEEVGLLLIVVDYPRTDASDWRSATAAAIAVAKQGNCPVAVVATLPELMPPDVAAELVRGGVVPLMGVSEAVTAAQAATSVTDPAPVAPLPARSKPETVTLSEAEAKSLLAGYGLTTPQNVRGPASEALFDAASGLRAPLVLKAEGLAHKSDAGGVVLGLAHDDLRSAVDHMQARHFLIEEMVQHPVAELLLGVTRDPAHGFVLTVAAGGVLTELLQDRVSMLVPAGRNVVAQRLSSLRIWPLLCGYRGRPAADTSAVLDAVMALQDCVVALADRISEAEINPLICTVDGAVAADALVVIAPGETQQEV